MPRDRRRRRGRQGRGHSGHPIYPLRTPEALGRDSASGLSERGDVLRSRLDDSHLDGGAESIQHLAYRCQIGPAQENHSPQKLPARGTGHARGGGLRTVGPLVGEPDLDQRLVGSLSVEKRVSR